MCDLPDSPPGPVLWGQGSTPPNSAYHKGSACCCSLCLTFVRADIYLPKEHKHESICSVTRRSCVPGSRSGFFYPWSRAALKASPMSAAPHPPPAQEGPSRPSVGGEAPPGPASGGGALHQQTTRGNAGKPREDPGKVRFTLPGPLGFPVQSPCCPAPGHGVCPALQAPLRDSRLGPSSSLQHEGLAWCLLTPDAPRPCLGLRPSDPACAHPRHCAHSGQVLARTQQPCGELRTLRRRRRLADCVGPGLSSRQSPPNNRLPCPQPGRNSQGCPAPSVAVSSDQLTPVSSCLSLCFRGQTPSQPQPPRVPRFPSVTCLPVHHLSSTHLSSIIDHLPSVCRLSIRAPSTHPRPRTLAFPVSVAAREANRPPQSPRNTRDRPRPTLPESQYLLGALLAPDPLEKGSLLTGLT